MSRNTKLLLGLLVLALVVGGGWWFASGRKDDAPKLRTAKVEKSVKYRQQPLRWDGIFLFGGGGSNFRESYGFKAWHFENQESQLNADLL